MLRSIRIIILGIALLVLHSAPAYSQLDVVLESWEGDLGNWSNAISNGQQVGGGSTLAIATNGATDGTNSLGVTQFGDTFELDPIFNAAYSYDAEVRYTPGDPQLDALNQAFDIGAQHFELQLDVTYVQSQIGGDVNVGIGLEGAGTPFNTQEGLAASTGSANETISIARALDDWAVPQSGGSTFFDVSFGLNGNWGGGPATVYFDQLRLVQVSEPTILEVEIDRATGATRILNGASQAGSLVEFDYYEVTSGAGSLDIPNWTSLESTIDSGWIAAGGSNEFELAEANLLSSSQLDAGESFSLGNAWATGGDESSVAFNYREPARPGVLRSGLVTFIGDGGGLICDIDGNGDCDAADIDMIIADIVAGNGLPSLDLNGDGLVDLADRDVWLAEAGAENLASGDSYLLGDANLDGVVDVSDFGIWNSNKFTNSGLWSLADFNADGVTDVSDFGIWNGNKFTSADAVAVPEPTGVWMLGWLAGVLGISVVRRFNRN